MDELLIFLKIGLLIFSAIAVISHMSSQSDAKSKAKDLIGEQGGQSSQQTTDEELAALNKTYGLKLTAPCSIIELEGDLSVSVLTTNGAASNHLVTIDGNQVHIPKDQIVDGFVLLPNYGTARLAIVESKLYLLEQADYRIVEQVRSNLLQDKTSEAMTTQTRGKIDSLPLEITGQRDATELERWHFDPAIVGKRYAIPMMIAFAIAAFVLHDNKNENYLTWAITYGSIVFIGFGLWFYSVKRDRNACKITRMRGHFNEVAASEAIGMARVSDDNDTQGWVDFQFPAKWVDKFKLNSQTEFEVSKEGNFIVSIVGGPSFDRELRKDPPAKRRCYGWMSLTLAVLVASVLLTLNGPQLHLMKDVVKSIDEVDLNELSDWQGELYAGQRIHAKSISRMCIPPEPIERFSNLAALCDKALLVDSLPELDLFALAQPRLDMMAELNKSLVFGTISDTDYMKLRLQHMMMGDQIVAQKEIILVEYADLNKWAAWAESIKERDAYDSLKKAILNEWADIKEIDQCGQACWDELLSNDTATFGKYGEYTQGSYLRELLGAKEAYFQDEVRSIVTLWAEKIRDQAEQVNSNVEVVLIDQPERSKAWTELTGDLDGNTIYSLEYYRQLLRGAADEFSRMQTLEIEYGVIQSVSDTTPKRVEIYTQFSEPQYQTLLVKEVLLLLSVVLVLLFLLSARSSRQREVIA
jgi:hypothetical protein